MYRSSDLAIYRPTNQEIYQTADLAIYRLFILLVGFAGFFHIDEIRNIALRDVSIHSDHMSVYVPQRKNVQYREGHTAFLARTGKVTCPVAVTERLIKLLPQSSSAFPFAELSNLSSLRSIFIVVWVFLFPL